VGQGLSKARTPDPSKDFLKFQGAATMRRKSEDGNGISGKACTRECQGANAKAKSKTEGRSNKAAEGDGSDREGVRGESKKADAMA
jgi:hypothetical protein